MKRLFLILLLPIILVACSEDPEEQVYTVDELKADDVLRAEILEKCKNNPGELGQTPNCVNAPAADWQVQLDRRDKALSQ